MVEMTRRMVSATSRMELRISMLLDVEVPLFKIPMRGLPWT
jgi:hypothetical protein